MVLLGSYGLYIYQEQIMSGSLRKQGLGVSPIVQQNQEFSIQNEDFPALPGFKGSLSLSLCGLLHCFKSDCY